MYFVRFLPMRLRWIFPPVIAPFVLAFELGGAVPPALAQNSAPVVSNVVAQQTPGTGFVTITYDVSDAEGDSLASSLVCSSNNGATFDLYPITVTGDVHRRMAPGTGKQITWNAAIDYPGQYWTQVVAKVVVSDGPVAAGEMVLVPSGNFTMGSTANADEQPVHTVYLDAFYIDTYEVTNAQFKTFVDAGGYTTQAFWSPAGWAWRTSNSITEPTEWSSGGDHSGPGWPGFPVVGVSWYEAEAYANFVGKRLPTEAEWEKAARGTDARTYPWGEGLDQTRANYLGSGDPYESLSTPVGFYDGRLHPSPAFQTTNSPGPYGTYDQAGNALEWVKDWYDGNLYYSVSPSSNPTGPVSGSIAVLRGGDYGLVNLTADQDLRCAKRYVAIGNYANYKRTDRYPHIGFRCVRTP